MPPANIHRPGLRRLSASHATGGFVLNYGSISSFSYLKKGKTTLLFTAVLGLQKTNQKGGESPSSPAGPRWCLLLMSCCRGCSLHTKNQWETQLSTEALLVTESLFPWDRFVGSGNGRMWHMCHCLTVQSGLPETPCSLQDPGGTCPLLPQSLCLFQSVHGWIPLRVAFPDWLLSLCVVRSGATVSFCDFFSALSHIPVSS
jgi:hypothetical protein